MQRADLCHVGSCGTSLNAQSAVEKSGIGSASSLAEHLRAERNRGRLHRPGGPTGGHWEWLWSSAGKVPRGVVEAVLLFNSFLPKHKF